MILSGNRTLALIFGLGLVGLLIITFSPPSHISPVVQLVNVPELAVDQPGGLPLSKPNHGPNNLPNILVVIDTVAKNYPNRIKQIRETWAVRVHAKPSMHLIFVGSHVTDGSPDMFSSDCVEDYYDGDSCKRAQMATIAHDYINSLQRPQTFDWVYFADDDVYIFPDNLQSRIMSLGDNAKFEHTVWAMLGCFIPPSCHGICGGGGYLMNRRVLNNLVEDRNATKYPTLAAEVESFNKACGRCGDLTISSVIKENRNITLKLPPDGMFVWVLKDEDVGLFKAMQDRVNLPYLFHYPAKNRLPFIHEKAKEFHSNIELD